MRREWNGADSGGRRRVPALRGALALAFAVSLLLAGISLVGVVDARAVSSPDVNVTDIAPAPPSLAQAPSVPATVQIRPRPSTGEATGAPDTEPGVDPGELEQLLGEFWTQWWIAGVEQSPAETEPTSTAVAAAPAATATPAAPAPTPRPVVTATPAAAVQPAPAPAPPATVVALSTREQGLFSAMNRERIAHGLAPPRLSAELLPIARARSADMSEHNYFAHFSPDGESVYTLMAAAGLRFSAIGENLARVSGDAERSVAVAIEKLMESASHRANNLNTAFSAAAVGAVTGADGVTVFTTVLSGG